MRRVEEATVVWRHRDGGPTNTVKYFVTGHDRFRGLAEEHATTLTDADLDAIEEYQRACEDGVAVVVNGPARRKVA